MNSDFLTLKMSLFKNSYPYINKILDMLDAFYCSQHAFDAKCVIFSHANNSECTLMLLENVFFDIYIFTFSYNLMEDEFYFSVVTQKDSIDFLSKKKYYKLSKLKRKDYKEMLDIIVAIRIGLLNVSDLTDMKFIQEI